VGKCRKNVIYRKRKKLSFLNEILRKNSFQTKRNHHKNEVLIHFLQKNEIHIGKIPVFSLKSSQVKKIIVHLLQLFSG